jgi:integrase
MSIYKRGKIYWAHFGCNGQDFRESLKTSNWQEAKDAEKKMIAAAEAGKIRGKVAGQARETFARLPFDRALELYRRDRKPELAPRTFESEEDHSKPLAKFFGDRRLNKIREWDVRAYISQRHEAGLAPATINKEFWILAGILTRAKTWHQFAGEIKPFTAGRRRVGRALEHGDKLRLLRISKAEPRWNRARLAMLLALNTTCRAGELRNLQWRDVNFLEPAIQVRRAKTPEGDREIPLNRDALDVILELRDQAKLVFGDQLAPDWHVFFAWTDGAPDATRPIGSWRSAWRSITRAVICPACGKIQDPGRCCAGEKCGADIRELRSPIAGLRFHDLRHHAITELSEGQASDETIMAISGHVDRRMMSHYSHVRKAARRAALDRLCAEKPEQAGDTGDTAQFTAQSRNLEGVPLFQVIEKNGGDDGTRTRDLCRDRAAF